MKYLSHYMNDHQTVLFDQTGTFFAFGNKQFEEGRKEGAKYVSFSNGMFCPVENVDVLLTGLKEIHQKAIHQDVEENGAARIIEREYFNYETQIAWDDTDARAALLPYQKEYPELFSDTIIKSTFKNCYNKAVENDWF